MPRQVLQTSWVAFALLCFMIAFLGGGALILAGPIILWTSVLAWTHESTPTNPSRFLGPLKRIPLIARFYQHWPLWLAGATSLLVVPRLCEIVFDTTIPDRYCSSAMAEATALFEQGRFTEALTAFQAIPIPRHLGYQEAQRAHNVGVILLILDREGDAVRAFERAIEYDPENAEAHYLLGRIALRQARHELACSYLRRARSLGTTRKDVDIMLLHASTNQRSARPSLAELRHVSHTDTHR